MTTETTARAHLEAFLQTIRSALGAAGAYGYSALSYGDEHPSYFSNGHVDHPRIARQFTDCAGRQFWLSAAGAYRLMAVAPIPDGSGRSTCVDTWDRIQRKLALPDFSPRSQDRAAIELIAEAGALHDVHERRFELAIDKLRYIWPSLASAERGTRHAPLGILRAACLEAGVHLR